MQNITPRVFGKVEEHVHDNKDYDSSSNFNLKESKWIVEEHVHDNKDYDINSHLPSDFIHPLSKSMSTITRIMTLV